MEQQQIPAFYSITDEGALDRYPGWSHFWRVDIGDQIGGYFPNEAEARAWVINREMHIARGSLFCPWTENARRAIAA